MIRVKPAYLWFSDGKRDDHIIFCLWILVASSKFFISMCLSSSANAKATHRDEYPTENVEHGQIQKKRKRSKLNQAWLTSCCDRRWLGHYERNIFGPPLPRTTSLGHKTPCIHCIHPQGEPFLQFCDSHVNKVCVSPCYIFASPRYYIRVPPLLYSRLPFTTLVDCRNRFLSIRAGIWFPI